MPKIFPLLPIVSRLWFNVNGVNRIDGAPSAPMTVTVIPLTSSHGLPRKLATLLTGAERLELRDRSHNLFSLTGDSSHGDKPPWNVGLGKRVAICKYAGPSQQ